MSTATEIIAKAQEGFNKLAGDSMKYDAEARFALQAVTNSKYLTEAVMASPMSLKQAVINLAAIGLTLNPAEKLAYLIPRGVKIKDEHGHDRWVKKVFLEPSYMGLIRLATNSGSIRWVQARCVYSNEHVTDRGIDKEPLHERDPFSKDPGEFVGVYCVAKTVDGDYLTTFMPADKVEAIKQRSEAVKQNRSSPWDTDPEEMAKKAVMRQAFKTWPRTNDQVAEAVHMSNENEGFEPIETQPKLSNYTADQKQYFDQMIEQGDALGMYLFSYSFHGGDASSGGFNVWTSLNGTFPHGMKGQYQKIVNDLCAKGLAEINAYAGQIEESLGGDDEVVKQLIDGLPVQAVELIQEKLPEEMRGHFAGLSQ